MPTASTTSVEEALPNLLRAGVGPPESGRYFRIQLDGFSGAFCDWEIIRIAEDKTIVVIGRDATTEGRCDVVRRDTGEDCPDSGIKPWRASTASGRRGPPIRDPSDPDAKVAKMKDGRTPKVRCSLVAVTLQDGTRQSYRGR